MIFCFLCFVTVIHAIIVITCAFAFSVLFPLKLIQIIIIIIIVRCVNVYNSRSQPLTCLRYLILIKHISFTVFSSFDFSLFFARLECARHLRIHLPHCIFFFKTFHLPISRHSIFIKFLSARLAGRDSSIP